MIDQPDEITEKADAAFRAAMLSVIETCRRTKTPLITEIDGQVMHIPYDQIENYIDIDSLRQGEANGSAEG